MTVSLAWPHSGTHSFLEQRTQRKLLEGSMFQGRKQGRKLTNNPTPFTEQANLVKHCHSCRLQSQIMKINDSCDWQPLAVMQSRSRTNEENDSKPLLTSILLMQKFVLI